MSKSLGNVMDPLHVIHGATLEQLLHEVKVQILLQVKCWMLMHKRTNSMGISLIESVRLPRKLYVKSFPMDFRSVALTHYA